MLNYGWKRLFSGLLALVLVIGMLPPMTVAAEETEATEVVEILETGPVITEPVETEPVEGTEAPEETVPETTAETVAETTEATEETVAETTEATEFVLPENVAAVQALIDALPTPKTVTAEDYDAVQAAYDAYEALTEEEKTLIQGAEVFEALFAWFDNKVANLATIASGTCGENLTWVLDSNGTLTISGTGEMENYQYGEAPWYSNRNRIVTVAIGNGVTSIGNYAFLYCYNLANITLPENITKIGCSSFGQCSRLASITMPMGLITIEENAFSNCDNLTSVTIPAGVNTIGARAFEDCSGLTSVTLSKGVTSIGAWAFNSCSGLTSITIPDSVTSIGAWAFNSCSGLTSITIPDSVTSIGSFAFIGCSNLTSITIPSSVISLGYSPFSLCSSLTNIAVDKGNLFYHSYENCIIETASKTLVLGLANSKIPADGSVTSIGQSAFYGCTGLTSVAIPDSVTTIGDQAFYRCSNLTSIAIPDHVTSIGNLAFWVCRNLTSVTIPESVTTIGDQAFDGCEKLKDVYFGGTKTQWSNIFIGNDNDSLTEATIHYTGIVTEGSCGENLTWKLDGDGTLTISGTGAMTNYNRDGSMISDSPFASLEIKKLVFEEGITHIGNCAFTSCTGDWGTVVLPESLESIGDEAFHRCTALTGTLVIPKNVRRIAGSNTATSGLGGNRLKSISVATDNEYFTVYKGILYTKDLTRLIACPGQKTGTVTFPNNLEQIDPSAFFGCSGLTGALTFPEGLQSIGMWAFVGCTGLKGKINLPSTVETIDLSAFGSCSGLTGTLTLPHGVRVDRSAFWGCSGLTEVNIPGDVTFLGDSIFGGCTNIQAIYFDGTEDQWNDLMQKKNDADYTGPVFGYIPTFNCYGKDFGWGVWDFNYRYWECMSGTLTIGCINGAEGAIPDYSTSNPAPWSSYQFQNLVFDGQVTGIGNYAFYGCNGLTSVDLPDSITYIGNGAFQNCQGLTIVELGTGVASIGDKAFADCSQLTDFRVYAGNQSFCSSDGSLYNTDMSKLVCVPGGLSGSFTVPYGVTTIDKCAFSGCDGLTSVVIPVDVTLIGNSAFSGCTGLTDVYFTGSAAQWKAIKMGTSNTPLTDAKIHYDYLVPIEQGTCGENLNWVLVEGGALYIAGEGAIPDYSPENPAPWSSYQFQSLVIEGNVTRIGDYAFQGHWELTYADLNNCVKSVGTNAFHDCTGLEEVLYHGCKEEHDVLSVETGNDPLVNAKWTYYFLLITGAQNLGDGLTSGQSTQLTATMKPDDTVQKAKWVLPEEYQQYATLTSSGKITAKNVSEKVMITVWAEVDGYGRGGMSFYILPKVTSLTIDQGSALTVDMHESATLNLTATTAPEDASNKVTWSTSDKKIATVDGNGLVTLRKPGTVTITATATDGSKKSDKVTLTVYYLDTASKLTATADAPTIGLQPGQTANLTVKGRDVLPVDALSYSIPENQQHIATVKDGVVTAGNTPGTVTVTVSLNGDPLKRTATCKIKVIPYEVEALSLTAAAGEPARLDTHNGEVLLILDAEAVKEEAYTFTISAQGMNYLKQWADTTADWATGNTAIATVKANADGSATVTVNKGSSGECVITGTAKGLTKATARLWLSVRDYAPRLETTSPAMNLYQSSSVDVALQMSYENGIESVSLYEKKEISQHFTAAWENGTLTITSLEGVKKGTYTQTLKVTCDNGEPYDYTLKIKVTETAPSVTVKQTLKPNLFYTHTTAALTLTAKNAQVTDATVIGGDFTGEFENGVLTLTSDVLNPGKKVTLAITVAGYEKPVEKTISLSTVTTAPKLKLSATSSVINLKLKPAAADRFTTFRVLNGTEVLELTMDDIAYSGSFATCGVANDTITLTLTGEKGGTATLLIQKSDWTKAVKLTHKVTVQTALPTLKLGATTLKLNSVFPDVAAETTVSLSQANLALTDVVITPKTSGLEDVLSVTCDGGKITAKITGAVKAGTYSYTCTGYIGETALKAVTLKVTVSATNPKVKLASTTFKLNKTLAGKETVTTKVTVPAGYTLVGFNTKSDNFTYESGYLTAMLGEEDAGGSYTLYPILKPNGSEKAEPLSTGIKVKVTTYSAKVTATVTAKGKLDTLNPDSAITYTVKLKNCAGMVSGVTLSGQDAALFNAHVDETGKVIVTTKETVRYATDQTYKVTLDMTVCGQTVSKGISFKVTQSALKVSPGPSSLTCYQALGTVSTTLSVSSPATAEIAQVTLGAKTAAAFRNALGENGLTFDPETGCVTLRLAHPGLLTPGKSYTLLLDVTPKHNATNVKPTQVKLTVKVQK